MRETCARHESFYLGSIGGAAARRAQDSIRKVEVLEYPELGKIWNLG
ncbi:MAG: fumarate hydratase C-terminal domain-containing protein [Pseudomonadota bacterium]|nr:fumarate hydratase C-terminal domain-containing protein [Pseudomonadota bacterium]